LESFLHPTFITTTTTVYRINTTMTIHASTISGAVPSSSIPSHIYNLPQHLQAQPQLVRFACQSCLVALVTVSKPGVSDGTVKGFARAFMEDEFCKRNSSYGVCSGCREAHKSGCSPVSAGCHRNGPC
jgi:hypothetical protein